MAPPLQLGTLLGTLRDPASQRDQHKSHAIIAVQARKLPLCYMQGVLHKGSRHIPVISPQSIAVRPRCHRGPHALACGRAGPTAPAATGSPLHSHAPRCGCVLQGAIRSTGPEWRRQAAGPGSWLQGCCCSRAR